MDFRQDEIIIKEFGDNLRRCRLEKGLSQADLAAEIDMSTNAISEIERGITDTSLTTIVKIARALQIPPAELFIEIKGR